MWRSYFELCKPRVVLLMLITAWAGMVLANSEHLSIPLFFAASLGIAFVSGGAAALNHVLDKKKDAVMERTQHRPLPSEKITSLQALLFSMSLSIVGMIILLYFVNSLTAFLTLAAGFGYAIIYTLFLKQATPQNIVIGGLSGAMPPLLGWAAATAKLDAGAWILVLIIFAWTPAHFWALCLYRKKDYAKLNIPMLPITHGDTYTQWQILFYNLLTQASSLLPFAIGMSGYFYLIVVILLNLGLWFYTIPLWKSKNPHYFAIKSFRYSIIYLGGLFLALLLDHYLKSH